MRWKKFLDFFNKLTGHEPWPSSPRREGGPHITRTRVLIVLKRLMLINLLFEN